MQSMQTRTTQDKEITGTAEFSSCGRFRYTLTRTWDMTLPSVAFIMLNPSVANAEDDDPTIRRCIGFAKSWGRGKLLVLNLYAYRATVPADMWKAQKAGTDIIGGQRNWVKALKGYVDHHNCDLVVAAWGAHGKKRGPDVMMHWGLGLTCLGKCADGSPKHPLYLKGDSWPVPLETQ